VATPLTWLATTGLRNTDGTALAGAQIYFYLPNTTTQTAVYADADETSILSQPVTANAAGQATVFVTSIVKMVIQTSAGAAVATIDRATANHEGTVEVESPAFNGTLSDGTTGAGGKVSLHSILTKAKTSLGGTDWNLLLSATADERAVKTVIAERGLSVKDFGAVGNGVATDTSAFRDCIDALSSLGGGCMIVPKGTYQIDDELAISANGIWVMGYGINVSVIRSTVTNKNVFTVASGINFKVSDIKLTASSASSAYGIQTAGDLQWFERTAIDNFADGIRFNSGAFMSVVLGCLITAPSSSGICIRYKGTGTKFHRVYGSYLEGTGNAGIGVQIEDADGNIAFDGCLFNQLDYGIKITSGFTGTYVAVNGCDLSTPDTGAIDIAATGAIDFRISNSNLGTAAVVDASSQSVASAGTVALTPGRTYFNITGATQIDLIDKRGWVVGMAPFTLKFASNPVVRHNQAAAGNGAPILLSGAGNFSSSADDTLTLAWDGTNFREVARTVI
jgi:hypothetical protein